jgi:polyhydroxyalkanoate synthesis regulator phasin
MTDAVAKGEMTRAQRQARIQQLLEEIDKLEEANQAKLQMDRLEREMLQDMRRQSVSPLLR